MSKLQMALMEKKILVVEDHADSTTVIRKRLENMGYTAIFVPANGLDALNKACEEKPHLILFNTLLPRMSSLEVVHRLKADHRISSIPILAVVGVATPGDREKCLENGCDGYLAEPFSRQELKAEIEKLLTQANQ